MSPMVKLLLAATLLALAALAVVHPDSMIAPGKLIAGHADLESDCFACHAPFRGVDSARCVHCHKPADIGRVSTRGQPIEAKTRVPFHQRLAREDCAGCHVDHAGVMALRRPMRFDHALLQPAVRSECESCHRAPADSLHRQIEGGCARCHRDSGWRPATFDHRRYFVLDRDHDAPCGTCHVGGDYARYTCYGCHEHTPGRIRAEHAEEGIRDFADCVRCHRSAQEPRHGRERGREREEPRDD